MSMLFRTQQNTPDVYYNDSRDFQLIGRLYDCVINSTKFDIDTMIYLTNTYKCRNNVLPLLSTKVGFFPLNEYNNEDLRYIVEAFPTIVKSKGSLKSVQQAINVFLKMNHVQSSVKIWYINESSVVYGSEVDDHTIIIGFDKALTKLPILEDVLRYILPTGFGFYFFFYNMIGATTELDENDNAVLLYASDNITSQIRAQEIEDSSLDRLIDSITTTSVAASDSIIPTVTGGYEVTSDNRVMFLGIFDSESEIEHTPVNGNYAIINQKAVYYENSTWNEINFKGIKENLPTSGRHKYDIVGTRIHRSFYAKINDTWEILNFRGHYNAITLVVAPVDYDCIEMGKKYYYYLDSTWHLLNFKGWLDKVPSEGDNDDLFIVEGVSYYLFNGSAWVDNTLAIYILVKTIVGGNE